MNAKHIDTRIADLRLIVSMIDQDAEAKEARLAEMNPGTLYATMLREEIARDEAEAVMYFERLSRLEAIRDAALSAAAAVPCG